MPLHAGQSLSFYEILGPLGAGGMGDIYRARDTPLEREVAIKVLPEELEILYDVEEPGAFLTTRFDERSPHFSPDGKWIAYVSDQSGVNEVYLRRHIRGEESTSRYAVSTGGGGEPRWSRDGSELFYRRGTQMFAVSFEPGATPGIGVPQLLFDRPYLTQPVGRSNPNHDVALDGRHLMIAVSAQSVASTPVVHVARDLPALRGL